MIFRHVRFTVTSMKTIKYKLPTFATIFSKERIGKYSLSCGADGTDPLSEFHWKARPGLLPGLRSPFSCGAKPYQTRIPSSMRQRTYTPWSLEMFLPRYPIKRILVVKRSFRCSHLLSVRESASQVSKHDHKLRINRKQKLVPIRSYRNYYQGQYIRIHVFLNVKVFFKFNLCIFFCI